MGRPIAAFSVFDALALVDDASADPVAVALAEAEAEAEDEGVTEASVAVTVNETVVTGTIEESTSVPRIDVPWVVVHVT